MSGQRFQLGRAWRAAACWACAALVSLSARADTVTLRGAARIDGGRAALLRDVAELDGPHANELGDVEVASAGTTEVGIDQVRDAIKAARPSARFGALAFSGDRCTIRVGRTGKPEEAAPAVAAVPVPNRVTAPDWRTASELRDTSVRSAVASRLVSFLKADSADVRLAFAAGDERLLSMDGSGHTLDIQPTGLGSQVPVLIRVFDGDRIAAAGTVRVRAEQRREIVAAREALKRGDVVTGERVIAESRWVAPGERYATGSQVIGMVVKNRIEPGQVFIEDDVEPAVVIRRGDVCTIACLSGSIVLNVKARALANGREGETIEFAPAANPRTRVRAKVLSAGQAVINASAPEDHVFGDAEVAPAEEKAVARAGPAKVSASAEVGTIQVQRVTERPDGSIIVEAKTPNGKRPTKKMRFLPLDE